MEVWMERIRQLRQQMGLSQAKLAVVAGMDPATLNRLEQGKGNPNLKTLERVAGALGVEVVDLFPKVSAPPPEPSFEELMDAERRGGATDADIINDYEGITRGYRLSWRGALEALAAPWEVRLRSGDFDRS